MRYLESQTQKPRSRTKEPKIVTCIIQAKIYIFFKFGCHFGHHLEYINIHMCGKVALLRFRIYDPNNLYIDPKMVILCQFQAVICMSCFLVGHFGRHLEYLNFSKGDKMALLRFGFYDPKNPCIDPKMEILCQLQAEISMFCLLAAILDAILNISNYPRVTR